MIDLGLVGGQVQSRIRGFSAQKVFAIRARFWVNSFVSRLRWKYINKEKKKLKKTYCGLMSR